jgi:hypothetical protein
LVAGGFWLDPARATIRCAMLWQSRYRLPSNRGQSRSAGQHCGRPDAGV